MVFSRFSLGDRLLQQINNTSPSFPSFNTSIFDNMTNQSLPPLDPSLFNVTFNDNNNTDNSNVGTDDTAFPNMTTPTSGMNPLSIMKHLTYGLSALIIGLI
jgi:hypothetical protein